MKHYDKSFPHSKKIVNIILSFQQINIMGTWQGTKIRQLVLYFLVFSDLFREWIQGNIFQVKRNLVCNVVKHETLKIIVV